MELFSIFYVFNVVKFLFNAVHGFIIADQEILSRNITFSMDCCSGNNKSSEKGEASSSNKGCHHSTISYTYIPGAVKHTDYTSSQLRTGWAPERFRKRHIVRKVYEKPSHVVLLHHGNKPSWPMKKMSSSSSTRGTSEVQARYKVDEDTTGNATTPIYATVNKENRKHTQNKAKNYFGTN